MKKIKLLIALLLGIFFFACTPKVVEETQPVVEETPPVVEENEDDESASTCPTFADAADPDDAETNFVLYRDFLKANDWEGSFELWQKVYEVSPAADGKRNTVFSDGIKFYEHFMEGTDSLEKESYIDKIFTLYDELDECYPDGGYASGRKAFDLYYKYPHRASKEEIYKLFKQSIQKDGLKTKDFVVNPFTSLLTELYFTEKVSMEEAREYTQIIKDIVQYGVENCEGRGCERWKVVESYAPLRLEIFETVEGFFDCTYYMEKYYPEFEAMDTINCELIRTVYSRLKWGGCPTEEARFQKVIAAAKEHCAKKGPLDAAWELYQNGQYSDAIAEFERVADESEDSNFKGETYLLIAKIYNGDLKNFPKSRQYARKAAAAKPNWGEPYILIGRLYASSGPLCGPGRGWDSQIVTWPAIDMWNRAKRVDPSVRKEADQWIRRYSQYMPNKEDVFIRNLQAGQTFRVGCWIQETTTIRTSD